MATLGAGRIVWKRHTVRRMMERFIPRDEVPQILERGDRIEDYPDDRPYPSALFSGTAAERSLHVFAALDAEHIRLIVITVYAPDERHFEPDHRTPRAT